jgi:small subunit ribosomal protein S16
MAVRVRLTRVGSKKNPIWRVVVADGRSPRDGRSIETIGHYNPQTQPSTVVLDRERLDHWLDRGAVPSNTVKKLMRIQPQSAGATVVEDQATPDPEPESEPAPEAAPTADSEGDAGKA